MVEAKQLSEKKYLEVVVRSMKPNWLLCKITFNIVGSFLMQDRDRKLRIFAGGEHPFGDRPVETYVMPPRQVREMRPRARRAMIRAQLKADQQQQGTTNTRKGKKKEEAKAELVSA